VADVSRSLSRNTVFNPRPAEERSAGSSFRLFSWL
jgi:hypothetical protein